MKVLIFLVILTFPFCSIRADDKEKKDTAKFVIHAWSLNRFFEKEEANLDTLPDNLHILSPLFINDHSYTWLGRLGQPLESNNFFNRTSENDFIFSSSIKPYNKDFENNSFFTTNKPFTWFRYRAEGPESNQDQVLDILHTQNPLKNFNFGIDYDLYSTQDQYRTIKGKNHALSIFSSYDGKNYNIYGCFYYNNNTMTENGGIMSDSLVNYKTGTLDGLNVFLNNASSKTRITGVGIDQQIRLNSLGNLNADSTNIFSQVNAINYFINYTSFKRTYTDQTVSTDVSPWNGLYDNAYYNSSQTSDSVITRRLTNQLQVALPDVIKGIPSFYASLKEEHYNTFFDIADSTINSQTHKKNPRNKFINNRNNYDDLSAEFGIKNKANEIFFWQFNGSFYFSGYNAGNYDFSGIVKTKFGKSENVPIIKMGGAFESTVPPFYLNSNISYYYSNHFIWDKTLKYNQYKNSLFFNFEIPEANFNIDLKYANISNMFYFNDTAYPAQAPNAINVIAGTISKKFKLWHLYSIQNIVYQNDFKTKILSLPEFMYYTSTYWEQQLHFFTGGRLLFQLGFDGYYNTSFFADAYMPATGIFYNQRIKQLGDYPRLDAFLKVRIKTVSLVFEYIHVNAGYTGVSNFNALHYPMLEGMFTYGLSWLFDD